MKNFRIFCLAALLALCSAVSCSRADVSGVVSNAPEGTELRLKRSIILTTVDSVKLGPDGRFDFKVKMPKGEREFYYIYMGGRKLSSLILSAGDKVSVQCDTTGMWTVEGSEDCSDLRDNELALTALSARKTLKYKDYVAHYRQMMRYVVGHPYSLVCVPVFFQTIGDVPVFGQNYDGVTMMSIADSLSTVYPASPYVEMLRSEAQKRIDVMKMNSMIDRASVVNYPDVSLQDQNGQTHTLTEAAAAGPVLLVFWNASAVADKMFNQDVLRPIYDEYSASGLSIYQVGLLTAKAPWTLAVRQQAMPWTNVYDQEASSAVLYGVESLPAAFLVKDNQLTTLTDLSLKGIKKALGK